MHQACTAVILLARRLADQLRERLYACVYRSLRIAAAGHERLYLSANDDALDTQVADMPSSQHTKREASWHAQLPRRHLDVPLGVGLALADSLQQLQVLLVCRHLRQHGRQGSLSSGTLRIADALEEPRLGVAQRVHMRLQLCDARPVLSNRLWSELASLFVRFQHFTLKPA